MATEFKTFRGIGAAIRNVTLPTAEVVLFSDKSIDLSKAKAITYDEAGMVGKAPWANVVYDARGRTKTGADLIPVLSPKDITGVGVTTLGPLNALPYAQYIGGVFVEEGRFQKWAQDGTLSLPDWQKYCSPSYPFRTLVYSDDKAANGPYASRRYAGFHARVISRDGSALIVKVTQDGKAETGELRIDLDDPSHATTEGPVDAGEMLLTKTSVKDDEGAIYIDRYRAADLELRGPKLPPGMG